MKYFIIAGEASGDLHASNLVAEIRKRDVAADVMGLGGDLMVKQGVRLVRHYRHMAFMGFSAVVKHLPEVMKNIRVTKETMEVFRPDVLILVDYPSFNMRMAKFAKKTLHCPVYYYISPKIWAWKTYRIRSIKRYIDRMFTIFPFETEFYAKYNYKVDYVGNPTQETIDAALDEYLTREAFCEAHNLPNKPIIALLAGSRKQEIASCLPTMIAAVSAFKDYQWVVAGAPGVEKTLYEPWTSQGYIVFNATYQLLQVASAAVVNSGTATLETALIGTPQVVVYATPGGRFTYWLKENFLKTRFISLVNIIAGKEVVRELVAHLFTVDRLQAEIDNLLNDKNYRHRICDDYQNIGTILGHSHAAAIAADLMLSALTK